MPCSLCHRPQGDDPRQCSNPETWACKDAQIERLRAQVPRWQTIGIGADPAIGQWCVLYDGDPGATYPYQLVRAEAEEWGSVRPLAYWNRHAGDRWLPLEAP